MRLDMTEEEIAKDALSLAIGTIRDYMMCKQDKDCPRGLPIKLLKKAIDEEIRHYGYDEL